MTFLECHSIVLNYMHRQDDFLCLSDRVKLQAIGDSALQPLQLLLRDALPPPAKGTVSISAANSSKAMSTFSRDFALTSKNIMLLKFAKARAFSRSTSR